MWSPMDTADILSSSASGCGKCWSSPRSGPGLLAQARKVCSEQPPWELPGQQEGPEQALAARRVSVQARRAAGSALAAEHRHLCSSFPCANGTFVLALSSSATES